MAGKAQEVADSGSEWGSEPEEETIAEHDPKAEGDESEELGSSEEEAEETESDTENEEDEEAKKKAAAAEAKKKAAKAKKKAAEAKKKTADAPASSQKVSSGTPKKRKAESGAEATPKESAKAKKDESGKQNSASAKPAKPKTAKPPEVFGGCPLKDGTREGMTPKDEAVMFMAHVKAEQEKQDIATKNFVAAAVSDKGKNPKAMVHKCNGDPTTGHILTADARELVKRNFEESQTDLAILEAAVLEFECKTGATATVQISLPGRTKRARSD